MAAVSVGDPAAKRQLPFGSRPKVVTASEMQVGLTLENGTIDAVAILRLLQVKYRTKQKNCICVV